MIWPFVRLTLTNKLTGSTYLERWGFSTRLFGVYLHKIGDPDPDRDHHNHPWPAIAIVLKGRYIQNTRRPEHGYHKRSETVRWINLLGSYYHRILWVSPGTWTLVLHGPRRAQDWGFYREGRHVPWREYVAKYQHGIMDVIGGRE